MSGMKLDLYLMAILLIHSSSTLILTGLFLEIVLFLTQKNYPNEKIN